MRTKTSVRKSKNRRAARSPRVPQDDRLKGLLEITAKWYYWEQDGNLRFTRVIGSIFERSGIDPAYFIGKTRWELPLAPVGDDGRWDNHKAALAARLPFTDFLLQYDKGGGDYGYVSTTGQPVFDGRGRFTGYRGISKDVTERVWTERRRRIEHEVARLLAEPTDVAQATRGILRAVCEGMGFSCGAYWEAAGQAPALRCGESWSRSTEADEYFAAGGQPSSLAARPHALLQRACADGAPQSVSDMTKERPAPSPAAVRAGLRGLFVFPVKAAGKVVGAMEFYSREAFRADPEWLACAAYLAHSVGHFHQRKCAQDELLRFRAAIDTSVDSIYLIDPAAMRFLDFNEAACRRTGYSREELLQVGPQDLVMMDAQALAQLYRDVAAAGAAGIKTEMIGRAKNGGRAVIEVQHRALWIGDKQLIVSAARDITERRLAERAAARLARMYAALGATNDAILHARSVEELYRRVCEAAVNGGKFSAIAVFVPDAHAGRMEVVAAAGAGERVLREAPVSADASVPEGQGLVGGAFRTMAPCVSTDLLNDDRVLPWRDRIHRIGVAAAAALPLVRAGRCAGVLLFLSNDKRAFDDEVVRLLVRMAENLAFALDNLERDAERRAAEAALRASEEKYRAILENMFEGYFEVDLTGNYTFFNDAMCRLHACGRDELMGMNYREYMDPETAAKVFAAYNAIYRTGKPMQLAEWPFTRRDGTQGSFESSVQLMLDAQGRRIGFRGVSRDSSRRRQAEEALRANEEKYRTILESIEDAYYEVDLKGNLTFFNSALCRMLGYPERELMGLNYRAYQTPEVAAKVLDTFNAVYRTGVPQSGVDWEDIRKDGSKVLVECSVNLVKDAHGRPVGFRGMMRDVTARRRMEQALRESEARFRSLTDLSSDWYWEQDAEFRFTKFEGKRSAHGGVDFKPAVLGRLPWELPGIVPDSADWEGLREKHRRREPVRDFEYAYRDRKGTVYYIAVTGEPVFDDDGRFLGYRGTSRDITERKREERLLALEHAVTRCLAQARSARKTLQAVMRIVCESERWETAGFWVPDPASQGFRLDVGWMGENSSPAAAAYFESGRHHTTVPADGLIGRAWNDGKPLWVADMANDTRTIWRTVAHEAKEPSSFLFPVMAAGKPLGVFAFNSAYLREPDERLLRTASVLGDQVGQFLQRKQAERVLREGEARFRALTELSSDWYWEQDNEFRFVRIESRRADAGTAPASLLGKRPWETGYRVDVDGGWEAHRAAVEAHRSYRDVVMHHELPGGSRRYISVSGEPFLDAAGRFLGYRGVSREITEQKVAEERIQYLATHDGLTGLPNRAMFSQLLNHAIGAAQRYARRFALLFLDLDRFKIINDTLGHEAGDKLLQDIGVRLRETLRASDVVARLGGDEFVVLLQEVNDLGQVTAAARKILATVGKPLFVLGHECRVTASIGICLYPDDADDEQTLMKQADMAMYLAKEEGKNTFQFYSKEVRTQSLEKLALETRLRHALERDELALHYQAQIDFKTGAVTGVEALLRWTSSELGAVPPDRFIPLAEETGLIVPIGRWVLRTACAQNVAWQRAGLPPIRVAVNLSARQFSDARLLDDVRAALAASGMAPGLLEVEITEGMMMQNTERATRILAAMKELGVRIAIDDFGTGYSSLAQIKRYPIDTLKVDRSFIRDIPEDAENGAITEAIIAMGRTLSLTVIAEGVETREQAAFLRAHGCDEMQGYYFSRPIAADRFAELLRAHTNVAHVQPHG